MMHGQKKTSQQSNFHRHDSKVHQMIIHFKVQTPFVKWAVRDSIPS